MRKLVGKVTEEEKDEIKGLLGRQNGLNELAKVLTPEKPELYEKLVMDMGETRIKFDKWWDTMSNKYKWESVETGHWVIDFDTCEIYLEN